MINGIKLNVECVYLLYNVTATVSIWTIDVLPLHIFSLFFTCCLSLFLVCLHRLSVSHSFGPNISLAWLIAGGGGGSGVCCWSCCWCLDLSSMVKQFSVLLLFFFPFVSMSVKCDSWALLINEHYNSVFSKHSRAHRTDGKWAFYSFDAFYSFSFSFSLVQPELFFSVLFLLMFSCCCLCLPF